MTALNLTRLHLDRLPGVNTPFSVPAQPGVNLLIGPNEAGKSSLARAVFQLLWPRTPVTRPFSVRGEFSDDDGPLQARRDDNGPVTWTRTEGATEAPDMPGDHVAPCYRLGLLDLNRRDAGDLDNHLALEIRRQMAGGFDLAQVRDLFPDQSSKLARQSRDWSKARLDRQQCQNQQKKLAERERSLAGLEAEQARARMAGQRAAQLEAAHEHHTLKARENELETRLDELPSGMAQVRPGDHDDLVTVQERLAEKSRRVGELQNDIRQRAERIASLAVSGDLTELAAVVKQAETLSARSDESARMLASATAAVVDARQHLAPELLSAEIPATDSAAFVRLAQAHHELTAQQTRTDYLIRLLELELLRDTNDTEPDSDRSATSGLLVSSQLAPPSRNLMFSGIMGLTATAVVLGVSRGHADDSSLANVLYGTALLLGLWGGGSLGFWFRARSRHQQACRQLEDRCRQDGHPLPANWTPREALDGLLSQSRAAGERAGQQNSGAALRDDLQRRLDESQAALAAAATRRRELLQELGQDQNRPDPGLLEDLDRIARYRTLENQQEATRGAHQHNQDELVASLATGQSLLNGMNAETHQVSRLTEAPTVIALQAGLTNLRERQVKVEGLLETQTGAEKSLGLAEHELNNGRNSREAILVRLGIAVPDTGNVDHSILDAVLVRVKALPEYDSLNQELVTARRDLTRIESQLTAVAGLPAPAQVLALPDTEREKQLAAEHRLSAGAEELTAEIARIRDRIDVARRGNEWENARARENESAADLNEMQESQRAGMLGRLLIDTIEKRHEDDTQPPLLTEMNRYLTLFTGGRYRVRVTSDGQEQQRFVAVDNTDRALELSELSDGTRAQLLLAARLAFLVRSEVGRSLPLFLDEALTASDPLRFDAIAGALGELASEEGRQVFYLTSNPSDVAAWQRALTKRNLSSAHVIDLAKERSLADSNHAVLDLVALPSVPAPRGQSPAAYGAALQVPALRPWDHENLVHLFHLWKDDLDLVHRLLSGGPATLGQWRVLGAKLIRSGTITAAEGAHVDARGRLYGAFLDTWRVGRGKPLTREALVESDALSAGMLKHAVTLMTTTGGDGSAFMDGVHDGQVTRLNKAKKEALQDYLERHGYLDNRAVWPPEHIVAHVLDAVSEPLSAGVLTPDEVRASVLDLYRLAQPTNPRSAGSDPTD